MIFLALRDDCTSAVFHLLDFYFRFLLLKCFF